MSFDAIQWALKVTAGGVVSPAASLLLIVLADHHNPKHGCFPSQATLTKRLGVSERQLRRLLRELSKWKLITPVRRGRGLGYALHTKADDTGHLCPVSSEYIFMNTGHPCPVYTGHPCPVSGGDTGQKCPVYIYESVTPEFLTSNGKAFDPCGKASGTNAPGTCGALCDDPENTPNPMPGASEPAFTETPPEEPVAVKAEDVVKAHTTPMTRSEIFAAYEARTTKLKKTTASDLGRLWTRLHALYLPKVKLTTLSTKQMAMLLKAYNLAGPEFPQALAAVIEHWDDFCLYLKVRYQLDLVASEKHGVPVPVIAVVLKHIQPVMQFHHDGEEYGFKKHVAKPTKPAVAPPPAPAYGLTNASLYLQTVAKPSKEEALALLEEALKGSE